MHSYALLLLFAAPVSLDVPRYAPDPAVALRRQFEWRTELSFHEMNVTMSGQPVPQEYLPELDIESEGVRRLVVVDELSELADGRPTRLVRRYEEITETSSDQVTLDGEDAGSREVEGESELEGLQVAFEWDSERGEHVARFVEREGDAELLAGLHEDLDLRAFLPPAEVQKGESWSIDSAAIEALIEPGGALGTTGLEEEDEAFEPRSFEAEVSARLTAPGAGEGRGLVVIELEGEGKKVSARPTDLAFVPVVDGDATETRTMSFDLEGRIHWDSAAGRAQSCELTLRVRIESEIVKDAGQPGPSFETTTVLLGDWELQAEIEPAE